MTLSQHVKELDGRLLGRAVADKFVKGINLQYDHGPRSM